MRFLGGAFMTAEDLKEISERRWFHSIDFGGHQSSGRFPRDTPTNITLFGVMSMLSNFDWNTGDSVLDIGTYDELIAFGMAKLGPNHKIVATEYIGNTGFKLAERVLGISGRIEYLSNVQLSNLESNLPHLKFDLIVCAGVLYHLLSPMELFCTCRRLSKVDGFLLIETPVLVGESSPVIRFNGIDPVFREPYTYFVPSATAVRGMAMLAGFEPIKEFNLGPPFNRRTYLLKARPRQYLLDSEYCPPYVKEMLSRDIVDLNFNHALLEKIQVRSSMRLREDAEFISAYTSDMRLDFPYQPTITTNPVGKSSWKTPTGNNKA
jgi:2-polyprenyl-3-methyl-5-hydroxy-6-metoxy-1,4-benzoquinol methylase